MADAPAPYDQRAEIFKGLIARGATPQQAMGILYSTMGESSTALDPNSKGDGGKSFGFGQWNGQRKVNLDSVASSMGTTWNDPRAQVAHFFNEVDGPYKAELDRVKANAVTAADATNLWTGSASSGQGYERPATNNWQGRYIQGSQAARLDADGNPVWKTGPAAPLPTGAPGQGPSQPAAAPAAPTADTRSPAQKFQDAAKKGDVGGALGALAEGTSGKGGLADALKGAPPPASSSSPMLQTQGDNQGAQAEAGQQLLGQVLQQSAKPLSWSSAPYGAGTAGQGVPGTTINSIPGYPGMIVTPAGYV
jgi:hypothetical protein